MQNAVGTTLNHHKNIFKILFQWYFECKIVQKLSVFFQV